MVIGTKADPVTIVSQIGDPEIPFLSIVDLGIVRSTEIEGDTVTVTITPTYSGCPAMDAIRSDIRTALEDEGFQAIVRTVLYPAWTTDDITPRGRQLLATNGIAPPALPPKALCPRCAAADPRTVSEFGSTACKALMVCNSCGEPFDLFKQLR
ncbi:MAG TPA: 1,2-phenylacetyl-CoA epoxidase subunit PaaD [Acidimicrobiia bacterium]|nr:1,2-phenylacetyl-CoA epoxidase subunit PaaD [Acidimicrobiia bacterium]